MSFEVLWHSWPTCPTSSFAATSMDVACTSTLLLQPCSVSSVSGDGDGSAFWSSWLRTSSSDATSSSALSSVKRFLPWTRYFWHHIGPIWWINCFNFSPFTCWPVGSWPVSPTITVGSPICCLHSFLFKLFFLAVGLLHNFGSQHDAGQRWFLSIACATI